MALLVELKSFVKRTILAHEIEFYRRVPSMHKSNSYDTLRTDLVKTFVTGATEIYMNTLYRSLILDDDQYVTDFFNKLSALSEHTKYCLLNIVCFITINVHLNISRLHLNVSTLSDYLYSVNEQIDDNFGKMTEQINNKLDHKCLEKDIKTCDPNIKLFDLVSKIV